MTHNINAGLIYVCHLLLLIVTMKLHLLISYIINYLVMKYTANERWDMECIQYFTKTSPVLRRKRRTEHVFQHRCYPDNSWKEITTESFESHNDKTSCPETAVAKGDALVTFKKYQNTNRHIQSVTQLRTSRLCPNKLYTLFT